MAQATLQAATEAATETAKGKATATEEATETTTEKRSEADTLAAKEATLADNEHGTSTVEPALQTSTSPCPHMPTAAKDAPETGESASEQQGSKAEPGELAAQTDPPPTAQGDSTNVAVLTDADVKKMKVAELKEALAHRGLETGGKKAQLVSRLLDALA